MTLHSIQSNEVLFTQFFFCHFFGTFLVKYNQQNRQDQKIPSPTPGYHPMAIHASRRAATKITNHMGFQRNFERTAMEKDSITKNRTICTRRIIRNPLHLMTKNYYVLHTLSSRFHHNASSIQRTTI